jgi:predicted CXXCH cytochrome family protein
MWDVAKTHTGNPRNFAGGFTMKKVLVMAVLAALVATSASALSIATTKHDLSVADTGTNTEICVYCHTPHSSNMNVSLAPLWNRDTTNVVLADLYTSTTLNAVATAATVNATDAPLCLSCHDGAVGNTLTNPPNSGATFIYADFTGNAVIYDATNKMKNDHPVGIDVPAVQVDLGIFAAATINTNLPGALRGAGNTIWCSSCHDVHDNANAPFLIESNSGSALCLECHNK